MAEIKGRGFALSCSDGGEGHSGSVRAKRTVRYPRADEEKLFTVPLARLPGTAAAGAAVAVAALSAANSLYHSA